MLALEYDPAAHCSHTDWPDWSWKKPGAQATQPVLPAAAVERVPAGQMRQAVWLASELDAGVKLPPAHASHAVAPVALANEPAAHTKQAEELAAAANEPAAHAVHDEWPVAALL